MFKKIPKTDQQIYNNRTTRNQRYKLQLSEAQDGPSLTRLWTLWIIKTLAGRNSSLKFQSLKKSQFLEIPTTKAHTRKKGDNQVSLSCVELAKQ